MSNKIDFSLDEIFVDGYGYHQFQIKDSEKKESPHEIWKDLKKLSKDETSFFDELQELIKDDYISLQDIYDCVKKTSFKMSISFSQEYIILVIQSPKSKNELRVVADYKIETTEEKSINGNGKDK